MEALKMPHAIRRVQMADRRLPGLGSRCFWDGKLENWARVPEGNACLGDRGSPLGNGGATTRQSAEYSGGNSRRGRIRGWERPPSA